MNVQRGYGVRGDMAHLCVYESEAGRLRALCGADVQDRLQPLPPVTCYPCRSEAGGLIRKMTDAMGRA